MSNFIDKARIFVQAGNGGNGRWPFTGKNMWRPVGRDGGDGGNGGASSCRPMTTCLRCWISAIAANIWRQAVQMGQENAVRGKMDRIW